MSQSNFFLEGLCPGFGKITSTPDVYSAVSCLVKSLFIDRFPRVRQFSVCQERHAGCTEVQARSFGRDSAPTLGRAKETVPAGSGRHWTFYNLEHFVSLFVTACLLFGGGVDSEDEIPSTVTSYKTRCTMASGRSSCFNSRLQSPGLSFPREGDPKSAGYPVSLGHGECSASMSAL